MSAPLRYHFVPLAAPRSLRSTGDTKDERSEDRVTNGGTERVLSLIAFSRFFHLSLHFVEPWVTITAPPFVVSFTSFTPLPKGTYVTRGGGVRSPEVMREWTGLLPPHIPRPVRLHLGSSRRLAFGVPPGVRWQGDEERRWIKWTDDTRMGTVIDNKKLERESWKWKM